MKVLPVPKFGAEIANVPFRVSDPKMYVPYFSSAVPAGFPSPADDFIEKAISLTRYI